MSMHCPSKGTLEGVIYNMKGYLNPRWCLVIDKKIAKVFDTLYCTWTSRTQVAYIIIFHNLTHEGIDDIISHSLYGTCNCFCKQLVHVCI